MSRSTRGDFEVLPSCSSKPFSVFRIWGDKAEKTHNESQRTRGHLCHLEILQQGYQVGSVADKQSLLSHLCLELEIWWLARLWWGLRIRNCESAAFKRIISLCVSLYLLPPLYRADSWWLIGTQTSSRAAVCRLWSAFACEVSFDGVVLLSSWGWGAFKQTVFLRRLAFSFTICENVTSAIWQMRHFQKGFKQSGTSFFLCLRR